MPMDGLALGFIARELRKALLGGRVDRVTQPEKDMLVLSVRSLSENHKLVLSANPMRARVYLTRRAFENPAEPPMFCMLMRKHVMGGRIAGIEQLDGDRVLRIDVENRDELYESGLRSLYLELMGKHSNLTLVQDGRIVDAIRHVSADMSRVRQALPGLPFEMPPAQDKLDPGAIRADELCARLSEQTGRLDKALGVCVRGLSAGTAREIALRAAGEENTLIQGSVSALAERVAAVFAALPGLSPAVLYVDDQGVPSDALPFPFLSLPDSRQRPQNSLCEALDELSRARDESSTLHQRVSTLARVARQNLERAEKRLAIADEALASGAQMDQNKRYGELLTAGLHLCKRGQTLVRVPDFYGEAGATLDIPLDAALSPAQNAQRYYKRYQKLRAARELAGAQREAALREIAILDAALCDAELCQCEADVEQIRSALADAGLLKRSATEKKRAKKPPKNSESAFAAPDGTRILVGRNSVQNDRLTGEARGEETWLHAKNSPGSHVIIKMDGQPSEDTLLLAARLAAWFSKSRGAPGTLVDYTARKFVKKPGGAPLGFVIYTHQKTLSVGMTREEYLALTAAKAGEGNTHGKPV